MKFHFIKFLIKINIFDEYYKININITKNYTITSATFSGLRS